MNCPLCKGLGYINVPDGISCDVKTCPKCKGDGQLTEEAIFNERYYKGLINFHVKKRY